jgi:hypothetical protein
LKPYSAHHVIRSAAIARCVSSNPKQGRGVARSLS